MSEYTPDWLVYVKNGGALSRVPVHERTREVCMNAFRNWDDEIRWVPEEYIDEELCTVAVSKGRSLNEVPRTLRTRAVVMAALAFKKPSTARRGRATRAAAGTCRRACSTTRRCARPC